MLIMWIKAKESIGSKIFSIEEMWQSTKEWIKTGPFVNHLNG